VCLNPIPFRRRYTNRNLGPALTSLRVKRAQAEYHVRRIAETRSDPTALFRGQNVVAEPERLAAINAEVNAAMHVLRTMLDILAHVVNLEKALGLGPKFYFHDVKNHRVLAGTLTQTKMEELNTATGYLRDFDNYTKHNRVIRIGAQEDFDVAGGRAVYRYPVEAFRNHPSEDDAVDLVCRVYDHVITGIAAVLDSL
jgi:hypothetical protein